MNWYSVSLIASSSSSQTTLPLALTFFALRNGTPVSIRACVPCVPSLISVAISRRATCLHSLIPQLHQKSLQLRRRFIALRLDLFRRNGILAVQILQRTGAGALVGAQVAFVGLQQQAVQTLQDHALGFVGADFLAGCGDKFFLFFLGGAQFRLELLGFVFQCLMAGEACFDFVGFSQVGNQLVLVAFLFGELGAGPGFFQLGLGLSWYFRSPYFLPSCFTPSRRATNSTGVPPLSSRVKRMLSGVIWPV